MALALQLDEAERAHLVRLLHAAGTTRPPRRRPVQRQVRGTVQRVLDSMVGSPAFVLNGRGDILAANALGRALFAPVPEPAQPTSPGTSSSTRRRRRSSEIATRSLPTRSLSCGPRPGETPTTGGSRTWLVSSPPAVKSSGSAGQPTTSRSPPAAPKLLRHPVVGDLDIQFESMQLPGDADQSHPATRGVSTAIETGSGWLWRTIPEAIANTTR